MIALFQVALPYDLLILPGDELQPLAYEGNARIEGIEELTVLVGPPYHSGLSEDESGVVIGDPDLFNPAEPQPIETNVEVGGVAPVRCDAIVVRIIAGEFDRRQETAVATVGSLVAVVCDAVNGLLQRLRVLARATHMKPLTPDTLLYRVVLLDDSGALLEAEEGKWRQTGTASFRIRHAAMTPAIWEELADLGEYETPPWDELLLDAMDLDVELGPSLVLAATAVETRIANALDVLANGKVSPELWAWINERNKDYTKTPGVAEQLDQLLKSLGGRSLKDDPRLWEAGVHLRQARNSFVHNGRAVLGNARTPVARQEARELVGLAGEIIDFIEALLPEDHRRPRLRNEVQVTTTLPITAPQARPAAG